MKLLGSLTDYLQSVFKKDSQDITLRPNQSTTYTAARDMQLPPGDADHVLSSATSTQAFTNKTITDATNNISASRLTSGTIPDARVPVTAVTQHEASIDHDALTNFVANEHIDWTSTTQNLNTTGTIDSGALSVTGNITVTGTVDGRDVASDGTTQDSHIAASSGVHGVTGQVVGTTDTQTLSGKTITSSLLQTSATLINQAALVFRELAVNGTNAVTLIAPDALSADYTLKLPTADGAAGEVLTTDGGGNLSFAAALTNALNEDNIFVGNSSNIATQVDTTATGDITANTTNGLKIANLISPNSSTESVTVASGENIMLPVFTINTGHTYTISTGATGIAFETLTVDGDLQVDGDLYVN